MYASRRKDYLWNTVAGVINAAEAVVMSMVATRFGELSDAGILSLAFAVGNVLMTIGIFGGKMFQATDIKKQYSYKMYLIQRFISLGLMVLTLMGFLLFVGYEDTKTQCIVLITFIYMIEVVENCIWGHYQLLEMLYVGAQMFCTRWIAIFIAFITGMVVSGNMLKSLFCGAIMGAIVFFVWIIVLGRISKRNKDMDQGDNFFSMGFGWLPSIFRQTFPLFVAGFCSIFISNMPKFAIDRYLNDEVQACYGFVAMPVFVIGLLNQFIYQPTVVRLTNEYYAGRMLQFRQNVKKQILVVTGIVVLCVCGAAAVGIPVLSIIYHTDLKDYWKELVILQFAGGFLALSGYFNIILTIMRKQKVILEGYIVALILGIIILSIAVKAAGTVGASVGYLIVMALLFVYYFVSYLRNVSGGEIL